MNHERLVEAIATQITERPGRIIVAFLLVTVAFAGGLANISTSSGTEQFTSGIPAEEALSDIQREFGPRFATGTGSTQLIQRNRNVLSKPAMLQMLEAQKRLQERDDLRVAATSSPASTLAREIDAGAETPAAQIRALERATPSEIDAAIRANADNPAFTGALSDDFNAQSGEATAAIGTVTHESPALGGSGGGGGPGTSGSSPLTDLQLESQRVVDSVDGDITVFGSGIISAEFATVISDSLLIVTPAAVLLITVFLIIAYRDLLDLLLGSFALVLATVWTFGFLGLAGIPFSQLLISVPPLLLAIGIDFGIHAVNRYREDRAGGLGIESAMKTAVRQLIVAFFIVTGTTVIGFLANLTSALPPIRDFGVVAAAGILFTFLIFGVFLPAAKVWLDRRRDRIPIPTFSQAPLGASGSQLGSVLSVGISIGKRGPRLFLVVILVVTLVSSGYAAGISTSFSQEEFLPPEETPYLSELPEPFAPSDYSAVGTINFLDEKFTSSQGGSVTVYVEADMERATRLQEIHRMGDDPPDTFVTEDGHADGQSIVTVIRSRAERDPEFAQLVRRNDRNADGIPDDNLGDVYDYLLSSSSRGEALQYLATDRRSTRVVYATESDASQDAVTADGRAVADRYRGTAVATGGTVVFKAVSDLIFESAVQSLAVALSLTVVFLLVIYGLLEGLPTLGLVNTVPIVISVALVAATMRAAGIAFNAFTATILSLTIGLGIDYSVHIVHRFVDERRAHDLGTALERTVVGTGGALLGSMLTTTTGIGVLVLAVLSILGQFGLLTALSIAYSFLASMLVLPSALIVWDRYKGHDPDEPIGTRGSPSGASKAQVMDA